MTDDNWDQEEKTTENEFSNSESKGTDNNTENTASSSKSTRTELKITQFERMRVWIRHKVLKQPKSIQDTADCVMIGPTKAGKSSLIASLMACKEADSHSYTDVFSVEFLPENEDYDRYLDELDLALIEGFRYESTHLQVLRPAFTIIAHAEKTVGNFRKGDRVETRFQSYDTAGGLLLSQETRKHLETTTNKDEIRARDEFYQALETCSSFIICLPMVGVTEQAMSADEQRRLSQLIHNFATDPKYQVERIILCLTKYEALGTHFGRQAYQKMATRQYALKAMRNSLLNENQIKELRAPLKAFDETKGSVWCCPASPFGFIPHNGGANFNPHTGLLRTHPVPMGEHPTEEKPYEYEDVVQRYWRPFLTLDPFMFVATKITENTLIVRLKELLK